ncbi:MAG: sulfur carrier protein ThiS [Gammaproteobacteria bacterium]|nr:sulfur carrier protein ThiS [Gammaproteobacteria bacterium]MBV8403099.1 sulfur carrier protein ThiS [Gammaproteobacteria bacterium]
MKILVNGAWRDTHSAALAPLLEELGYGGTVVTTAVNGEFVAAGKREERLLTEGDRLEVLAPMQGG